MLQVIKDEDYFTCPVQTLVNTVNCVGVMGKGIALEFKNRYPQMYEQYVGICDRKLLEIGKLWLFKTDEKWILNFPTKTHWRYDSKITYIEKGLQKFVESYKSKGILSIAFPLLGSSNGKLNPDVTLEIMRFYLSSCDIPIYIYLAHKAK